MHRRSRFLVVLLVSLSIGLAVRICGVRHGEPRYLFHPDAGKLARVAGHTYEGAFDPRTEFGQYSTASAYPCGNAILCGAGLRALDPISATQRPRVDTDHDSGWYWTLQLRYFSIGCALLALAWVLWVQRDRIGSPWLFLLGLGLAVEPLGAQLSHYGMNDVPMAAFLLAAWAASTCMADEPLKFPWASALTGLFLGLGFGVKYQAALGAAFPIRIWIACTGRRGWPWLATSATMIVVVGLAAALWTCPILRDPAYFLEVMPPFMRWQSETVGRTDGFWAKVSDNVLSLGRDALATGHWLLLPALVLPWLPRFLKAEPRRARELLPAALFCIVLSLAVVAGRTLPRMVDLLPIFPFCIIILANLLFPHGEQAPPPWTRILACITVAWFCMVTGLDSAALARPDTRERARDWCRANVKPGQIVFRENYTSRAI